MVFAGVLRYRPALARSSDSRDSCGAADRQISLAARTRDCGRSRYIWVRDAVAGDTLQEHYGSDEGKGSSLVPVDRDGRIPAGPQLRAVAYEGFVLLRSFVWERLLRSQQR